MADTHAPVAQPLSAEEEADLRRDQIGLGGHVIIDRLLATLDAARSVPDNAALREAVEWHLANPHNVNEGHSRLRAALASPEEASRG